MEIKPRTILYRALIHVGLLVVLQCLPANAERLYLASDIYNPGAVDQPVRSGQADEYFEQARKACEAGEVGQALQLATEAVVANPNHADARRVLGYRRIGEHWAGSYAARRLERGETWHPEFGWIQAGDAARYEAGQRPLGNNRWITAEEDAKRHATIDDGWRVRTDHFQVTTNHSLQAATRLIAELEALHQAWLQLFGGFAIDPADLLKRFDGQEASGYRGKPFQVVYHRTRDEYNTALRKQQPRIEITLGIYFDTTRKTHFFAGEGQDAGTIYHEAVHQFFQESRPSARNVGATSNAWLIEGVACYFESLVEHTSEPAELAPDELPRLAHGAGQRYYTIGEPTAGRLPAARHRRLVDDYYVELAELSTLGIKDFQQRSDLPRLYSQAAGLATFLMHYDQGKYRSALGDTLQLLYAGRDKVGTLERMTGQSFPELDREYREFLAAPIAHAEAATPTPGESP